MSTYLAEDYFLCQGFDLNLEQAELLRKRIIGISIVSALIDAVVVPLVMGFVFAFILDISLFFQCLIVLVLYKVISIVLSIKESHFHFIDSKW
ncbi:MAG: hypothetical protein LWW75_05085, partial [Chlorobiales bacterium]|nr:hypothetical protein [Chlorobiales bacterium]